MTTSASKRFGKKRGLRLPQYMHSDEYEKMGNDDQNSQRRMKYNEKGTINASSSSAESSEETDFVEWGEDESDSDSITSYDTNEGDKDDEDVENVDLEELSRMRHNSVQKLRSSWERIIRQYGNRRGQNESPTDAPQGTNNPIEPIPAIGTSWKPAHSVVPPLSQFQGSAGFMIAPEWQILPSEEDEEEGAGEDEEDDEDIIDFEANDWEKKLQYTSYFAECAEKTYKNYSRKSKERQEEVVSTPSSSPLLIDCPSPKRPRNEKEQNCEQNLNSRKSKERQEEVVSIPSSSPPIVDCPSPKRPRNESEQSREKNLNSRKSKERQEEISTPSSSSSSLAINCPSPKRLINEKEQRCEKNLNSRKSNERQEETLLSFSYTVSEFVTDRPSPKRQRIEQDQIGEKKKSPSRSEKEVHQEIATKVTSGIHQHISSKSDQQKQLEVKGDDLQMRIKSPKRHDKRSQQKVITKFMTSSKPNNKQMSSWQCKGRNECTKSFCLICGGYGGLGSGLSI